MTKYLLPLLFAATVVAEESTLEKFGALVIRLHQGTEDLFVNINSHTWAETEEQPCRWLLCHSHEGIARQTYP